MCIRSAGGICSPNDKQGYAKKSGNSSRTIIFFFLISCPELTAANTVDEYFTQVAFEEYMYPFWKKFHNLFFMNSIFSIKFFVNSVNRTVFFFILLKIFTFHGLLSKVHLKHIVISWSYCFNNFLVVLLIYN